jgi:Flp pilus assembly protein TadB
VSKERARRRAERDAARAVAEAKRQRQERRRAWRAALVQRLRPPSRRWAWGLGRRTPGQRSALIGFALAALLAVWYFVDSWPSRIALGLLVLLALPVVAVVTFDRKGMKL